MADAVVRDEKGRWLKGTVPNPKGRSKREVEVNYYSIFTETVTPDIWRGIVVAMAKAACKGDVMAARLLMEYGMGKPSQTLVVEQEPESRTINLIWGPVGIDDGAQDVRSIGDIDGSENGNGKIPLTIDIPDAQEVR